MEPVVTGRWLICHLLICSSVVLTTVPGLLFLAARFDIRAGLQHWTEGLENDGLTEGDAYGDHRSIQKLK